MTRADMDRDKAKKPGELKKELAEMVGRVADEQTRCRIEGWKSCMRHLKAMHPMMSRDDFVKALHLDGKARWGSAFDA